MARGHVRMTLGSEPIRQQGCSSGTYRVVILHFHLILMMLIQ